jgi:hypothetical protein
MTVSGETSARDQSLVAAILAVGERDLLFADRYRLRAEQKLDRLCPRARFLALEHQQAALERHVAAIREATAQAEWDQVRILAHEAAGLRETLASADGVIKVARVAYGLACPSFELSALAVNGVVVPGDVPVDPQRDQLLAQLRQLIADDPDWAPFYRERLEHFIRRAPDSGRSNGAAAPSAVRHAILAAMEQAEFGEIERLAASADGMARGRGQDAAAFAFSPSRAAALAEELPAEACERAASLGLIPATLEADADVRECVCAWGSGTSPERAVAGPSGMCDALRETLALVLRQPFVTSGGNRYLPLFVPEHMLVETFAEDDPDAHSPLLALLGLSRRRGLSRMLIEDALRQHTTAVCEALGLDPLAFVVVCIPFDAYMRLAPRSGWGRQTLWTHLDGYQLTPERYVRALVGGDVRYGGADDLCSVGRRYDSDHLTVRFAIVRRVRFLLYEPG